MASDTPPKRLAVVACIDMAGYSALAERDEAQAAAAVAVLHAIAETVALQHSGRIFNTAGDGFLLEFQSATNALRAALAVLDQVGAGAQPVRIGILLLQRNRHFYKSLAAVLEAAAAAMEVTKR